MARTSALKPTDPAARLAVTTTTTAAAALMSRRAPSRHRAGARSARRGLFPRQRDEISAYTTGGSRSLTSGDAITMVDQHGKALARPVRLNESAFKTVSAAA
jgi:hypothetical protein